MSIADRLPCLFFFWFGNPRLPNRLHWSGLRFVSIRWNIVLICYCEGGVRRCIGEIERTKMGKGKALSTGTNAVIWFRRGLRLHDNPALLAAIQGSETVTPVYVINTKKHGTDKCGRARMKFILESLSALDEALKERNSSLVVLKGENENDVLLDSMKKWKTNRLCFEAAPEPHLKVRRSFTFSAAAMRSFALAYQSWMAIMY